MFFQPRLRFFHSRRLRPDDIPEPMCMVGLDEMRQFMNDNVVYNEHRRFDQPPVEVYIIMQGTGAPAKAVVRDLDSGDIDNETKIVQEGANCKRD